MYSTKKQDDRAGFDFDKFEQKMRWKKQQEKSKKFDDTASSGYKIPKFKSPFITLTSQTAADLTLMNLPKYVSMADLKRQYHKLAKIYHPDIRKDGRTPTKSELKSIEEKFKEFNQAYERLQKWIEIRDSKLDESLMAGNHPSGIKYEKEESDGDT